MTMIVHTCERKAPSTKRRLPSTDAISVKRMKNLENSYLVKKNQKPYCIVETSPYMVWNPDHTETMSISEQYKEKIFNIIHLLENL